MVTVKNVIEVEDVKVVDKFASTVREETLEQS